jgi:hypothetical protein
MKPFRKLVGQGAAIPVWKQPTLPLHLGAECVLQAEGLSSDWDWQVMRKFVDADREWLPFKARPGDASSPFAPLIAGCPHRM